MLSWFPLFFPFKVRDMAVSLVLVIDSLRAQEPLYLPSNSELQVSIWRLTNERQVWYEWHAESFLSMLSPAVATPDGMLSPSGSLGNASLYPSTSMGISSPLVDAVDTTFLDRDGVRPVAGGGIGDTSPAGREMVKIGQTSLHNPGGRSSWIGL